MRNKLKENKFFSRWRLLSWIRSICFFVFKYPVIRNAFFCLESASEKSTSEVYTQALMAYAFCLAGKAEKCELFLEELQKSAKEVGEFQSLGDFAKWEYGRDLTDGLTLTILWAWIICGVNLQYIWGRGLDTVRLQGSTEQWHLHSVLVPLFVYSDGSQHWEQEERSPSDKSPSFLDHAPSAEVEITSYALLALLYKPNRNKEDLTKASGIVQWIIRQQNPYGGFSSTQVPKLPYTP